jgi:hypothetical protein
MQPITIKLDPKLHSAIRRMKSRDQTLTDFVRDLVAREEKHRGLEAAAEAYATLLDGSKEEAAWLPEWESAPLATPPKLSKP